MILKNIPLSRAIIYLLCIGLLPIFFVGMLFISAKNELIELSDGIEQIKHQAFIKEKKQALNLAIRQHFREADHFYIDKYLETLVFLEPEIEQLQTVMQHKNFADDERVKKRIDLLTTDSNALTFSEGVVQTFPLFQETVESLTHPVEVNVLDIKKILSRIEGVKIGDFTAKSNRPQLLITDFKLEKKTNYDKNEVYLLNLKLIKREFL